MCLGWILYYEGRKMSNCQDVPLDNDAYAFPVIAQTVLLTGRDALLIGFGVICILEVLVPQVSVRGKKGSKESL